MSGGAEPSGGAAALEPGPGPEAGRSRRPWHARLPIRVQRPGWLLAFFIGAALLVASPLVRLVGVPTRSLHLGYGVAATALMIGALLLGLRRRLPTLGPGRVQSWVQLHIYGGALFLGAVGFHSGWAWPQGTLDRWLITTAWFVVLSGLGGVVLRRTIPVLMTRSLESEVLYERIPDHVFELKKRAEETVARSSEAVRTYYRAELADEMEAPSARWRTFFDVSGTTSPHSANLDKLAAISDRDGRDAVAELRRLLRAKRELDAHWTLQRPLRWWLVVHVPIAWLLVVLVAVHLWSVATY